MFNLSSFLFEVEALNTRRAELCREVPSEFCYRDFDDNTFLPGQDLV